MAAPVLAIGAVELDSNTFRVRVNGEQVHLTPTEFRLLEFFMRHPGHVFTREQLQKSVWPASRSATPRRVDVNILRLRRKIEIDPDSPVLIRSTPGFGYGIELPPQTTCPPCTPDEEVTPTRKPLHHLIDRLPNNELHAAEAFLKYLCEKRKGSAQRT